MDEHTNTLEKQRSDRGADGLHLLKRIDLKTYTKEEVEALWGRLKTQEYAFDDSTKNRPGLWVAGLAAPMTEHFEFGQDGYVQVANIQEKVSANIHFAVWNKTPISKIVQAGRELITYLFTEYKLNRVSAFISSFNDQTIRLATLLGFKYEGEVRGAFLTRERYYGILIYGLLHSEYLRKEVIN